MGKQDFKIFSIKNALILKHITYSIAFIVAAVVIQYFDSLRLFIPLLSLLFIFIF